VSATPKEKLIALNNTRVFLKDLTQPGNTPRVPKAIRDIAAQSLEYYPPSSDDEAILRGLKAGADQCWKDKCSQSQCTRDKCPCCKAWCPIGWILRIFKKVS